MSGYLIDEKIFKVRGTKTVTFDNTSDPVTLFTVTGDVIVKVIPVVTTDVTSAAAANIRLGVVGNTDAMIVDSLSTNLTAINIWADQTRLIR